MAVTGFTATLPFCCGGLFFLLFGGGLAYYGAQQYLLCQKIADTPTSKVRSAAAGLVELFGKAECKDKMYSPISKAKCAYWHIHAEYYQSRKNNSSWITFFTKSSSSRFYLQDDTGKMLVDPKDAQFSIAADFKSIGHMSNKALFGLLPQTQLDPAVLAWLETDPGAKAAFNSNSGRQLRVFESFIAEDDPLYVLGSAEPIPDAASAVHEETLVVKKNNFDKIMFISDSGEKHFLGNMRLGAIIYLALGLMLLGGAALGIILFWSVGV